LELAEHYQPSVNAFTEIARDEALVRATCLDDVKAAGGETGPLHGIPIGLKDLIDQAGHTTTAGSAFYRHEATRSAPAVERLEGAGAVIIGRTGLHEFAFGFSSENPHFGPVRNPWDTSTSPGGSSGGSGAAVAAGITPISIGTDTGGSVRVPAAMCGTYGLKVTHGAIPLDGVFPLVASVDTVGPLADSMQNIDLAYRAMSHDRSPEPQPSAVKLGIPHPWFDQADFQGNILAEFEAAVSSLRDLGHTVVDVQMDGVEVPGQIWNAIAEEVTAVHSEFRSTSQVYGDDVAVRLDDAAAVANDETALAREWQTGLRRRFAVAYEDVDFLLTPTVPAMVKTIGDDIIGGHHYRKVISYFSALVNQSLHPALAMPLGVPGSPPSSIQLIGRLNDEVRLISLGRSLEAAGLVGFRAAPINV
jgi:aspartyl-tRNA(Asn)/glutamyl-tRNA(Gln) amidotransferase subunit A